MESQDFVVSLKEFMTLQFKTVGRELSDFKTQLSEMRSAIERLAIEHVVLEQLSKRVDAMEKEAAKDRTRLAEHEQTIRVLKWLGGISTGLVVGLLALWLSGLLGL